MNTEAMTHLIAEIDHALTALDLDDWALTAAARHAPRVRRRAVRRRLAETRRRQYYLCTLRERLLGELAERNLAPASLA